jgi:membrane-bound lytic murein transglycosylase B
MGWGTALAVSLGLVLMLGMGNAQAKSHKAKHQPSAPAWGLTDPVIALSERLAQAHQLPPDWVKHQLSRAHRLDSVLQLVMPPPPGQRKNWAAYRARFIDARRIADGVRFWRQHQQAIARASQVHEVPDWLIVGVIGVETLYGQHMGKTPVLDSLTTLSLAFPSAHPRAQERQRFFENELGVFLSLARKEPELLKAKGSYAGAMGWGQFMPSSIQRFAVDFDGNGHINLNKSAVDAIGSVANYFKQHGWQPQMVTHVEAVLNSQPDQLETLLLPDILPTFSPERMAELGVSLPAQAASLKGPLALVELQNGSAPSTYVVGTENFYVVTRYNWSSYYAMAVMELGQAVKAELSSPAHRKR